MIFLKFFIKIVKINIFFETISLFLLFNETFLELNLYIMNLF